MATFGRTQPKRFNLRAISRGVQLPLSFHLCIRSALRPGVRECQRRPRLFRHIITTGIQALRRACAAASVALARSDMACRSYSGTTLYRMRRTVGLVSPLDKAQQRCRQLSDVLMPLPDLCPKFGLDSLVSEPPAGFACAPASAYSSDLKRPGKYRNAYERRRDLQAVCDEFEPLSRDRSFSA